MKIKQISNLHYGSIADTLDEFDVKYVQVDDVTYSVDDGELSSELLSTLCDFFIFTITN